MEQSPTPDFLCVLVTCQSHTFFCAYGQRLTELSARIQLSQALQGAVEERFWARVDQAAMRRQQPGSFHSESPDGPVKEKKTTYLSLASSLSFQVK